MEESMKSSQIVNSWKRYIETNLLPVVNNNLSGGRFLEGNIYSKHKETSHYENLNPKIHNIINLVTEVEPVAILEIGFNAGFSTLLMKMVNPAVNMTCIDINEHNYVVPCHERISKDYPGIELITERSGDVLSRLIAQNKTYDIIHIDGDHRTLGASQDLDSCLRLCNKTVIIFDDTNLSNLNSLCNRYVSEGKMKDYDMPGFVQCVDKSHRFFSVD
jgi:predicted O-methyltransferase YrrM